MQNASAYIFLTDLSVSVCTVGSIGYTDIDRLIFLSEFIKPGTMHETQSPPTLEDVARAAGVSTATVSRTLNTPERVVERTRVRVMEVVEQLGKGVLCAAYRGL